MKRYIKAAILDILNEDKDYQLEVASDINSPIDDLMKLARNGGIWSIRRRAISTIKRLANSSERSRIFEGDPALRDAFIVVCFDPNLLSIFAEDPDYNVRWSVAMESSTPPETLDKLSYDSNFQIRSSVADNSSTPDYTLAHLARDEKAYVRRCVANNPKTPYAILQNLVNDPDYQVRESVLSREDYIRNSK